VAAVTAHALRVPGDKSISHRALLFAALAAGESRIRDILDSADVRSTAGALQALGVDVAFDAAGETRVVGRGLRGLREPAAPLDCGNSGTTTRLLAGIVAAHPMVTRMVGDASLSGRPMRRVAEPLTAMGATFEMTGQGTLPMTIRGGALRSIEWTTKAASAQVKSAVLLAGLVAGVPVAVREPAASRDHTERMLAALGVGVVADGLLVRTQPVAGIPALDVAVPGDPSSAAFLVALGVLLGDRTVRVEGVCLNPTRTGFLAALARMGAAVRIEDRRVAGGEDVGDIVTEPQGGGTALAGIEVGGAQVPAMIDELPLLACVASQATGETIIRGAEELRVKESDRIRTVVENLRAVGADASELPDGLRVTGSRRPLRGRIVTHGDHRIAMSFGVLGALPGNAIEVDDPECVGVSYPRFWRDVRDTIG
jgi:3-phosphoshikimate 1-carboxyvinyltransferase